MLYFIQVCSSLLVSPKWIESLFDENTTRYSPLDFRLTAASQFRILALMCWFTKVAMNDVTGTFLQGQLVSTSLLPRKTFEIHAQSLIDRLAAAIEVSVRTDRAAQVTMMIITQNRIHSALHTNEFHISVPGSNIYEQVKNYYPLYENASYSKVSI